MTKNILFHKEKKAFESLAGFILFTLNFLLGTLMD